ncbi:MAG: gamma-glutamyl-gamma-aminobutyrate hydrolase family protein [Desulfobacter sp.]|nr:MAG: gamma-glutamyl-gamma-aminobutyrate hydrolase family protein [Desulfobacter sp.]
MAPFIAIVAHIDKNRSNMPAVSIPITYIHAIEQAGGIPYILPFTRDLSLIQEMAMPARGFLFPGRFDLDPAYFNEAPISELGRVDRDLDEFQLAVLNIAMEKRLRYWVYAGGPRSLMWAWAAACSRIFPPSSPDRCWAICSKKFISALTIP